MTTDNSELDVLIEAIKKEASHLGLHMKDVMIAGDADSDDPQVQAALGDMSMKEMLENPDVDSSYAIMTYFLIGDMAFSDRVQFPDKFNEEQQFKAIVPGEHEILKDKVVDKIARLRDNAEVDEESFLGAMFDDDDDEDW